MARLRAKDAFHRCICGNIAAQHATRKRAIRPGACMRLISLQHHAYLQRCEANATVELGKAGALNESAVAAHNGQRRRHPRLPTFGLHGWVVMRLVLTGV